MSTKKQQTVRSMPNVWSSRVELISLGREDQNADPKRAGEDRHRARTSKIEKEIIWAVVVLYAGIIACFAGLHIYGLTLG